MLMLMSVDRQGSQCFGDDEQLSSEQQIAGLLTQ